LREFGFNPKGCARAYQKPYPEYFDTKTTYEHVGQFLAQVNDVGITDEQKIWLFPLSFSGNAFNWFTSLVLGSVDTWLGLEQKFHDYFYNGEVELRLLDLTAVR
jgi:hypothetical protein